MENANSTSATVPSTETSSASKKQRSSPYPSFSIDHCIEIVRKLHKVFPQPNAVLKKADIASVIKSGYINQEIGSCVQYGLLDRSKTENEVYSKNSLTTKVSIPIGNELAEGRVEAFKNPKLYKELFAKYDGHVVPEKELPIILQRYHGITDKVSEKATTVFVGNAKDIGVLDEHSVLRVSNPIIKSKKAAPEILFIGSEEQPQQRENEVEKLNGIEKNEKPIIQDTAQEKPLALSEINNSDREKLRLPDNRVMYMYLPKDLGKRDLDSIRKWCDYYESSL